MKLVGILACALALGGCANPTPKIADHSEFLNEATREFPDPAARVIQAAQAVLRQSDPGNADFRYAIDGFTWNRKFTVYLVIAAEGGTEFWTFTTRPGGSGGTIAQLQISQAGANAVAGGGGARRFENAMQSVELYRLFWARVDYVLGRTRVWETCDEAYNRLQVSNLNPVDALSGLCGGTSTGRTDPPPAVMTPLPRPVTPPVAKRRSAGT